MEETIILSRPEVQRMEGFEQILKGSPKLKATAPIMRVCRRQAKLILFPYREEGFKGPIHQRRRRPALFFPGGGSRLEKNAAVEADEPEAAVFLESPAGALDGFRRSAQGGGDPFGRLGPSPDEIKNPGREILRSGPPPRFFEIGDDFRRFSEEGVDFFEIPAAEGPGPRLGRRPDDRVEMDAVGPDPGDGFFERPEIGRTVVDPFDEKNLQPEAAVEMPPERGQAFDDRGRRQTRMGAVDFPEGVFRRRVERGDDDVGGGRVLSDRRAGEQGAVGQEDHRNRGLPLDGPDEASQPRMEGRLARSGKRDGVDPASAPENVLDPGQDGFDWNESPAPDGRSGPSAELTIDAVHRARFKRQKIHAEGIPEPAGRNRAVKKRR